MIEKRPHPTGRPFRVGVCAEAFGFGPASKAASIVAALDRNIDIETTVLADSIAYEFLTREGLTGYMPIDVHSAEGASTGNQIAQGLDLAVVVLIPEWVPILQSVVPVVYVDSLSFLWERAYFEVHSSLREVAAYVTQDVFGSAERLRASGVRNVHAVGALTPDIIRQAPPRNGGVLVHVGGLLNIFSATDGPRYVEFVCELLEGLVPPGNDILMSKTARNMHPHTGPFLPQTLLHADTLARFGAAPTVFTSPGMTALLELTALRTPVVPLPPQNLSQARIVSEMAKHSDLPEIWRMLAHVYAADRDVPESEGVAQVRALNEKHAQSSGFRDQYRQLARAAQNAGRPLPDVLVPHHNGLSECANIIAGLLRTKAAVTCE